MVTQPNRSSGELQIAVTPKIGCKLPHLTQTKVLAIDSLMLKSAKALLFLISSFLNTHLSNVLPFFLIFYSVNGGRRQDQEKGKAGIIR